MVDLANTIHKNIVMTGDCPSNHDSGRVPMLDLEIFMEEVKVEIETSAGRFRINTEQIGYGFYKKPMASKLILCFLTAIPAKMKYDNAANELIRRILNMRGGMNGYKEEKRSVTDAFMVTLQISGYPEGFRHETALSAYRGVRRMEEKEAGERRKV